MKKFVHVLALALAVLMIAALAGCAKTPASSAAPASQAPSSAAPAASQQPEKDYKDTKFTIAWWGSDSRHTATTQLIEEFEKDYKNLKIDVEYYGGGDYWTKISTHAASRTLPDVTQMNYAYMNQYVDGSLLMELDSLIADKKIDLSNVAESSISGGKFNGKMYGIVTGMNAPAWIYNPEIAKEAGVTISATPTMDEFIKACETIYDKTGAMLINYVYGNYVPTLYGENLYGKDGKSCGMSEENYVDYLTKLIEGVEYGYIPNPETNTDSSDAEKFSSGKFWAFFGFTNNVENYSKESGKDLQLFALPSTEKCANPTYLKPTMLWSIAANSKEPELAAAFINLYTNDIRTFEICGVDRGLPINSKLREELSDKLTPDQKKYAEFQSLLENGHVAGVCPPDPSSADEVKDVIAETKEEIVYGVVNKSNVAERAKEDIAKMDSILKAE